MKKLVFGILMLSIAMMVSSQGVYTLLGVDFESAKDYDKVCDNGPIQKGTLLFLADAPDLWFMQWSSWAPNVAEAKVRLEQILDANGFDITNPMEDHSPLSSDPYSEYALWQSWTVNPGWQIILSVEGEATFISIYKTDSYAKL